MTIGKGDMSDLIPVWAAAALELHGKAKPPFRAASPAGYAGDRGVGGEVP